MNNQCFTLILLLAVGCATTPPHIELEKAPTRTESFEKRADYYKKHSASQIQSGPIVLHDGTTIFWHEDLMPAVDENSETGKAIAELERMKNGPLQISSILQNVSGLVILSGLTTGLSVFFFPALDKDPKKYDAMIVPALITGAILTTVGFITAIANSSFYGVAHLSATLADKKIRTTYEQSLIDRIGVKADANGLIIDLNSFPVEESKVSDKKSANSI